MCRCVIIRLDQQLLRLFSTTTTFGSPMDITLDEVAIELYYPADEASAAYLESNATGLSPRRQGPGP